MMALDNTSLFSTQSFAHGDANYEILNPLEMESPLDGFLEDDAFSCVESCKRRRLAPFNSSDAFPTGEDLQDLLQSFWDSSGCGEISSDANGTDQGRNMLLAGPTVQPMTSPQFHEESPSYDSSQIESLTELDPLTNQESWLIPHGISSPYFPFKNKNFNPEETENERDNKRKRKLRIGIISPFVVVKPGEIEGGGITLEQINRKIVTRPAKPVRHPVGEFACAPRVSASGPGLSGKSVVSLIRINTRGNGTITIIRTRE